MAGIVERCRECYDVGVTGILFIYLQRKKKDAFSRMNGTQRGRRRGGSRQILVEGLMRKGGTHINAMGSF